MTPERMVALARTLLNEAGIQGFWGDAELVGYLALAQDHFASKVQEADQEYFSDTFTLDWVAGQEWYSLPARARDRRLTNMERIDGAAAVPVPILPQRRADRYRPLPPDADRWYYLRANQVGFFPLPTVTQGGIVEVTYVRRLTPMQYGTFSAVNSATQQTLRATGDAALKGETLLEADLYRGARIALTGGTGAGQERLITAWDPVTRKITVDSAWSPAPDGASVYEILTDIPAEFHEGLVKYALVQAAEKDEDSTGMVATWKADAGLVIAQLVNTVQNRQVQEPEYVREVVDWDE